jgi:hypothetical protein
MGPQEPFYPRRLASCTLIQVGGIAKNCGENSRFPRAGHPMHKGSFDCVVSFAGEQNHFAQDDSWGLINSARRG